MEIHKNTSYNIILLGVFYKGTLSERTKNHEAIHWQQQKNCGFYYFIFIYLFEWIFKGYRNISFEKRSS